MAAVKAPVEQIVVFFSYERETKNKTRLQEIRKPEGKDPSPSVSKDQAVVEELYVSKKAMKKLQEPGIIKVTIEAFSA